MKNLSPHATLRATAAPPPARGHLPFGEPDRIDVTGRWLGADLDPPRQAGPWRTWTQPSPERTSHEGCGTKVNTTAQGLG